MARTIQDAVEIVTDLNEPLDVLVTGSIRLVAGVLSILETVLTPKE